MLIRFELEFWCDNEEPGQYVSRYRGRIFDYPQPDEDDDGDYSEPDLKIGEIELYHVDYARLMNEHGSLHDSMDDVSTDTMGCYEALMDQDSDDWKDEVQQLVGEDALVNFNILLINRLQIDEAFRGNGKGAKVVREVIRRFGSTCAVIVCKPFPLQYRGFESEENAVERQKPGHEKKRLAAFRKVAAFWNGTGFRKLPSSDHYVWVEQ